MRSLTAVILFLINLLTFSAFGQTPWLSSTQMGDQAWFLADASMLQFDLSEGYWVNSKTLGRSGATAMAFDSADGLIAFGSTVYRYSASLVPGTQFAKVQGSVRQIFFDGNLVIVAHYDQSLFRWYFSTFDRQTGTQLSSITSYSSVNSLVDVTATHTLFASDGGNLVRITYTGQGVLSQPSTWYEVFSASQLTQTKLWVSPDGATLFSESGEIFNAATGAYIGSLGGKLQDLMFDGDRLLALSGPQLIEYQPSHIESARLSLLRGGSDMYLGSSQVYAFAKDGTYVQSALSLLKPDQAGEPVVPEYVSYTADQTLQDADGNLLLLSRDQKSLFRWSPSERKYTGSFPLPKTPASVAISADRRFIYLANMDWSVGVMDLSQPQPVESILFYLSSFPNNLIVAGDYLVIIDVAFEVFTTAGVRVATSYDVPRWSTSLHWDPVYRRIYQGSHNTGILGMRTLGSDGSIGQTSIVPDSTSNIFSETLTLSPDGFQLVEGNGDICAAGQNVILNGRLGNSFSQGAWTDSLLLTLRTIDGVAQFQTWDRANNFARNPATQQFGGTPVALAVSTQGVVVVTQRNGAPHFHILDENFNPVFESPLRPVPPPALASGVPGEKTLSLNWTLPDAPADWFLIGYRMVGEVNWHDGPVVAGSVTQAVVSGLTEGANYEFRIQTESNGFRSSFSISAPVIMLRPGQPGGEPYNLTAVEVLPTQASLSWSDNASNETGIRLLRNDAFLILLPPGTTSYVDRNVLPGRYYNYRIQTVNQNIDGDLSTLLEIFTPAFTASPSRPSELAGIAAPGRISLSWIDQSTDELHFAVDRSPAGGSDWQELASLARNSTKWEDLSVIPGSAYSYRIRAVGSSSSSMSGVITVSAIPPGGVFQNLSKNLNGICYFALNFPDRIERYDVQHRNWLVPIPLSAVCTALWVDDLFVYVAEGPRVARFNLDGSNRMDMGTFTAPVTVLFSAGEVLCYGSNSVFDPWYTLDRKTAIFLSFTDYRWGGQGSVYSPKLKRTFSVGTTTSTTGEISAVEMGESGNATQWLEGDFWFHQHPLRAFLFPSEERVAVDSGLVYSGDSLLFAGGFGSPFLDLDFFDGEMPVVLRSGRVCAYTPFLEETGGCDLKNGEGVRLAVSGQAVVVFGMDLSTRGLGTEIVERSQLVFPAAGPVLDPRGLSFKPDFAWLDRDGNVLMLSRDKATVFRWSPVFQRYLPSLPLTAAPSLAAYSQEDNTLYIAHDDQTVRKLDLSQTPLREAPAFNAPIPLKGLTVAGHYPYVATKWFNLTYGNGWIDRPADENSRGSSSMNIWNSVKQSVYHSNSEYSTYAPLVREKIGTNGSIIFPPTTGDEISVNAAMIVSQDGNKLASASGSIFDAETLRSVATISGGMIDAMWLPNAFLTLHPSLDGSNSIIKVWDSASFAAVKSLPMFAGSPCRLITSRDGKVIVITLDHDLLAPRFYILADDLSIVSEYDPRASHVDPLSPLVDSSGSMQFNSATGLYERIVTVTNPSDDPLSGFDLKVIGLPTGATLYNGTLDASGGYLAYHRVLQPGESVTLLLQILAPGGIGDSVLSFSSFSAQAEEEQDFAVKRISRSSDGAISLVFPSHPGSHYVIEYSSDMADWVTAAFGIQAAGTSIQWTDRGAPVTASAPAAGQPRFYRVKQLDP